MVSLSNRITLVIALGVLAVAANPANAQRRGGFGGFSINRVALLTLDQVQAELKLTEAQKTMASEANQKLADERRELFQQGAGQDPGARFAKMQDMANEASAKLEEKLDDAQRTRLTELFVQVNGSGALSDQAVGQHLGLTDEQRQQLTDAVQQNREATMSAFQGIRDASDEERRETMQKIRQESDERLLSVLSVEQRDKFASMTGQEMELDLSSLMQRRGGGQGGGQGVGNGRRSRPE